MRLIPLTKGYSAIVDDDDYEFLSQWKWCAKVHRDGRAYAMRAVWLPASGRYRFILMHREVNQTPAGELTDHIDGDGLNNSRSNLRSASPRQNSQNSRAHRDGASKFKGVARNNKCGPNGRSPWVAHINNKHIGVFPTEEAAAAAYAVEAAHLFGEFNPIGKRETNA